MSGGGIGGNIMNRIGSSTGNNPNPYTMNYQPNAQGEQGSIGSSSSKRDDAGLGLPKLGSGGPGSNNIPAYGQVKSRGKLPPTSG